MANEDLEQLLGQLQVQSQQLQSIVLQKQALMIQDREIETALEEVEKADSDIFRSVGPLLVKTGKEKAAAELKEGKEEIELKLKALQTQEKRLKDRIKENQEKFQKLLPKQAG